MGDPEKLQMSTARAAFLSSAASIAFTIAVTLVPLSLRVTSEWLFAVLLGVMALVAAGTILFLLWTISDTARKRLAALRATHRLGERVPERLRVKNRTVDITVAGDGSCTAVFVHDLVASPGTTVQYFSIPLTSAPHEDGPGKSVTVESIQLDGKSYDTSGALKHNATRRPVSDSQDPPVEMEEYDLWVQVALTPNKTTCKLVTTFTYHCALRHVFDGGDSFIINIPHLTDRLSWSIAGGSGVAIRPSRATPYTIEARLAGEQAVDTIESQRQSDACESADGLTWTTSRARLSYRYTIRLSALRTKEWPAPVVSRQPDS